MTEQDYVDAMNTAAAAQGDREVAHGTGDQLVSAALRELGWSKLADAFDHAKKDWWYA